MLEYGLSMDRRVKVSLSLNAGLLQIFVHLVAASTRRIADEEDKIVSAGGAIIGELLYEAPWYVPQAIAIHGNTLGSSLHQFIYSLEADQPDRRMELAHPRRKTEVNHFLTFRQVFPIIAHRTHAFGNV